MKKTIYSMLVAVILLPTALQAQKWTNLFRKGSFVQFHGVKTVNKTIGLVLFLRIVSHLNIQKQWKAKIYWSY